jgi:hypothetical protein
MRSGINREELEKGDAFVVIIEVPPDANRPKIEKYLK